MTTAYVIASVGSQRVALRATDVESIIRLGEITPVPGSPPHIAGLCAVRSAVLTVVDVARAANQPPCADADHAAVVTRDGHRYALRIDQVRDIETIEGVPIPTSASIGKGWYGVAPMRIETSQGVALLLGIDAIVAGSDAINLPLTPEPLG
jgi:purine-binding chemotaxis protein CheW